MTVAYVQDIAEASVFGFLKLLLRWKGSLWKMVWKEMFLFMSIYFAISFLYNFVFDESQQQTYQMIAQYCNTNSYQIPLDFVIGFYVSEVTTRFYQLFNTIPFPHSAALYANILILGNGETSRKIRRTLVRYLCCTFALVMRSICMPVKKRFPTIHHLVEVGLATEEEVAALEKDTYNFYIPCVWATTLINHSARIGLIRSFHDKERLIEKVNTFRTSCMYMVRYDWVNLPLVYSQVVSLAVYLFCFVSLLGRYDFVETGPHETAFPFFTFLQFVFYISWLKVGQSMSNPYGEDDDDFEGNYLVDTFLRDSYLIVERSKSNIPTPARDRHWDFVDFGMPESPMADKGEYIGSAGGLQVKEELAKMVDIEPPEVKEKLSRETQGLSPL